MRKQEVKSIEYVLEPQDVKLIKECLNYCYHRIKHHNKFIIDYLTPIEKLRKEFGIIK